MKKFSLTALVFLFCISAMSQKIGKVSGIVQDIKGDPVASVTVTLLKSKDSAIAKTAITDKAGKYEIEFIPVGNYLVAAGLVG
jgi:iron complex outermembrane recepter protein